MFIYVAFEKHFNEAVHSLSKFPLFTFWQLVEALPQNNLLFKNKKKQWIYTPGCSAEALKVKLLAQGYNGCAPPRN